MRRTICPDCPLFPNHRQRPSPPDSDVDVPVEKPVLTTIQDYYDESVNLPIFSPDKLLGMTILCPADEGLVHVKVIQK